MVVIPVYLYEDILDIAGNRVLRNYLGDEIRSILLGVIQDITITINGYLIYS